MRHIIFSVLTTSLLFISMNVQGQNIYEIFIASFANARDLSDVNFELYQDGNKLVEQLSKDGTFQFAILEKDGSYKLKAWKEEFIPKIIHFKTQEYPFINEYEIQEIDIEFHKVTSPEDEAEIGELKWSSLGHVFNVVKVDSSAIYVKENYANSEKKLGEIYSASIDKGDELMALERYDFAKAHYEVALVAKPKDEYARRKLQEIAESKVAQSNPAQVVVDKSIMEKINEGDLSDVNLTESDDILFSVQLGAFSQKVNESRFAGVQDLNIINYEDFTRVFSGEFKNAGKAVEHKKSLVAKGYKDAWIVQMKGNKRVGF